MLSDRGPAREAGVNLPNTLSLVRIFLVPFLIAFLIPNTLFYNLGALVIFVAAVLTDWLDGRIARSTHQVSRVGQLLDPVADKLLIAAALISLVQVGRAPGWMVVVIVCRELAVTGLRGIAASQGVVIQASDSGKGKMVTEVVAILLMMVDAAEFPPPIPLVLPWLGWWTLGLATFLAFYSGIEYFVKFWRTIDLHR